MRKLSILGVVLTALALTAVAWSSRGGAATDVHDHPQSTATPQEELAPLLARARLATADYAISLRRALRAGYTTIVTQHMPDMGWHFMNPKITKFDVTKPPILVYVHRAGRWQLVAFEWVFTQQPATDPLPGAQYGSFAAACHYVDGTFHPAASEAQCRRRSPESGAKFGFWHPDLVTLHLWAWYPNPDGIFTGLNPLIRPFNDEPVASRR
jgi:hypothetical protein